MSDDVSFDMEIVKNVLHTELQDYDHSWEWVERTAGRILYALDAQQMPLIHRGMINPYKRGPVSRPVITDSIEDV